MPTSNASMAHKEKNIPVICRQFYYITKIRKAQLFVEAIYHHPNHLTSDIR